MRRLLLAVSVLFCLASPTIGKEYSTRDLLGMTRDSLYVDWNEDIAHVCGVGRIMGDRPQSILLARRGALADAGRGLLVLRQEILSDSCHTPFDTHEDIKLSGHVPPMKILSESIRDGLYFIEVETKLSALLDEGGPESLGKIQDLHIEEE